MIEEVLGGILVAVVVVTTAVETTGLGVDSVVVVVDGATVLPGTARGMTVFPPGLLKAWNPSVVSNGKSLVPGIPLMPLRDEGGSSGNSFRSTWGADGTVVGFNGRVGGTQ